MASGTDRHLARALSFSVCMKYDTESSEEEVDEERDQALELAAQVGLDPPERLHNRNSSIMGDFAAVEQQLALQKQTSDTGASVAMPPPAARKPAKKQAANEGTIQVCLRVRPACERERDDENCVTELTSKSITFEPTVKNLQSAHQVTSETYFFDRVFAPEATQTEVYEGAVESVVRGVVAGRPGLVFAFGITNAGKTFTIQGSTEHPGILPRALGQLFAMTKSDATAKVTLSFMEIYNENVYDLLGAREADAAADSLTKGSRTGPLGPSLQLQDLKDGVVVKGLTHRTIETVEQAANHLAEGIEFRQVAHTDSNHESSRSHSLVTITLERGDGTKTNLVVVDLAGSERAKKTNADLKLKESARINTSLMNLGRCLEVLRANQKLVGSKRKYRQVVPFRQAKITRVLREPLTGGGNVVMLCSIYGGSSDADETVHALRYASTAREVATLGAVSDKFMPAVAVNPKKRSLVPRCAEVGSKTRKADQSFTSNTSIVAASVDSKGMSSLSAQLREAEATIAQLRLQIEANDQVTANLEDEIREEMAEEMESVMNQMEETYQSKLEREIAIHEERFQHKLGILDQFGLDESQRSPARVAREILELEQLRKDKAELQQTADAQIAAVKSECARELEEARVQHSANVQMEVQTFEHQLSEANEENARLKQELKEVRKQLQHVTKISQSLIDARAEMQAKAATAGQTEKKKEKSRKKRKTNSSEQQLALQKPTSDTQLCDPAGMSVAMQPPAVRNDTTNAHTQQIREAVADSGVEAVVRKEPLASHQCSECNVSDQVVEMKSEELVDNESEAVVKKTSAETVTKTKTDVEVADTGGHSAIKSVEADVIAVVKETVEKVAVQADAQRVHQTLQHSASTGAAAAGAVDSFNSRQRQGQLEKPEHDASRSTERSERQENEAKIPDTTENITSAQNAPQVRAAEVSSGLSVTDQLKNRLNRLKKASAANSRGGASNQTAAAASLPVAAADAAAAAATKQQPEVTLETNGGQLKENAPPTPARSSRKRRTTGKVDEEVERFEALEKAAAADMSGNRRLTRSAVRQRVL